MRAEILLTQHCIQTKFILCKWNTVQVKLWRMKTVQWNFLYQ